MLQKSEIDIILKANFPTDLDKIEVIKYYIFTKTGREIVANPPIGVLFNMFMPGTIIPVTDYELLDNMYDTSKKGIEGETNSTESKEES